MMMVMSYNWGICPWAWPLECGIQQSVTNGDAGGDESVQISWWCGSTHCSLHNQPDRAQRVMQNICSWMAVHGLLCHKRVRMSSSPRRGAPASCLSSLCNGYAMVGTKLVAKYLNVLTDTKMSFFKQIQQTKHKPAKDITSSADWYPISCHTNPTNITC